VTRGTLRFAHTDSSGSAPRAIRSKLDLMLQIGPYRFGVGSNLRREIKIRRMRRDRGEAHRRLLGFRRLASSGVDDGGVTVLPGASGGDDEMCVGTVSPMVQEAASIACWSGARVRPERVVSAGVTQRFWQDDREIAAGFWRRRTRGGRDIYRGGKSWARG
jgi:hypothetical protein